MMTKSIRTGIAVAALLIAPIAAQAADLPTVKAPAYSVPSYANWTGFYVGINAGYGFGKSEWDVPLVSPEPKGAVAGLTLGYNFQTGSWMWGVEGDVDYSGMKGDVDLPDARDLRNQEQLARHRARAPRLCRLEQLAALRHRRRRHGRHQGRATRPCSDASKSKVGWTAGLGVEYAMRSNWSVKLEYLYVDLGSFDCGIACGAVTDNVSFSANLVRAGVNYRF